MPSVVSTSFASSDAVFVQQIVAYPASISAGNLLLLFASFRGTGIAATPSGFASWISDDSSTTSKVYVWYRVADGTESGNVAVAVASGGFAEIVVGVVNFTDAQFNAAKADISELNFNSPKVCPSIASASTDLVLRVAMSSGGTVYTVPSGTDLILSANSGGSQASHIDIASETGLSPATGTADYPDLNGSNGYGLTLGIESATAPATPTRRTLQLKTRLNTRLRTHL